jgi:ABC-type Fe3+/spermidine/putrescine transport system ATPase subunit
MRAVAQLRFVLRGKGLARKEREGRIARSLDLVGLLDRKRAFPHQLSGGELQRLALARALVVDPEIVLLDEPLSAADRALRTRLLLEIRRIQRELRIPMIYVTHDQEEALALADRIVVMREGRIEQDGTPREVYEKPRSRFVASFLGASNVVQARAIGNGGFATPLGEVSCPEADGRQAAWLSIRPEAIEVSPEGVACDVISGTYRGDRWLLQVARQGERFQVFGTSPPEPGQRVGVKIVGGAHLLEDDASVEREGEE